MQATKDYSSGTRNRTYLILTGGVKKKEGTRIVEVNWKIFSTIICCALLSISIYSAGGQIDISGATNVSPEEAEIAGGEMKPLQPQGAVDSTSANQNANSKLEPRCTWYGMDCEKFSACAETDESGNGTSYHMECVVEKRVWLTELKKPENKIKYHATLIVYADDGNGYPVSWSGSIIDSGYDSASTGGKGDDKIRFLCANGGTYSVAAQLGSPYGFLGLAVIQDGKLLDSGFTSEGFGLVSLAGNCF